jgi:hypothetical protein
MIWAAATDASAVDCQMPDTDGTVIFISPVLRPEPKTWRVVHRSLDEMFGSCDHSTRTVELDDELNNSAYQLADTALEESAHAALPDLGERAIKRLVKCQMALLVHLGIVAPEAE